MLPVCFHSIHLWNIKALIGLKETSQQMLLAHGCSLEPHGLQVPPRPVCGFKVPQQQCVMYKCSSSDFVLFPWK